jgi:hypothetical protein
MLVIEISSDGRSPLTLSDLYRYNIPVPPDGFGSEINNTAVMKFDDEQEAIDYSYELDSYTNEIDSSSEEYHIINLLIKAISEDAFVQSYIQN